MRSLLVILTLLLPALVFAQTRTVGGRVTTESEPEGLFGVNVVIEGTLQGTSTDFEGNFSLSIPDADTVVLVFSYIGYTQQRIRVGNRTYLDVTMEVDADILEAVIITGYRSELKANITGAVSSVTSEDIEGMPIVGMDQALQGQAAGVQVTQSSGTPGGGISVRIRGSTSINASNRPLFIVDGVPVEDGALALRGFGGQSDNALASLNPNDIASWQVLKDASAKAIYGSRAANGVIVITTKRGQAGKPQISMDIKRGIINPVKKLELLDATELLELQREAMDNAGINPDAVGLIRGVTDALDTDWLDEVLRAGILQEYQMSMSGGNEDTRLYLSAAYRDEEGVQLNNRFQRYSATTKIDHKINTRLDLGVNFTVTKTRNDRVKGDNFLDGVYSGAVKSLPFYSPFDENGKLTVPGDPSYPGFPNFNPVAQAVLPRFETHNTMVIGGIFLNYKINNDWSFRGSANGEFLSTLEDQFEPSTTAIGGFLPSVGFAGYGVYSTGQVGKFVTSNILNYNREFGKHTLSGLVGMEALYRKTKFSSVSGRLFPSDDFTYIASAGIVDNGSSIIGQNGLLSALANVKYDYEGRYLFTLNVRSDGSSRFGSGKRFGVFPAVSGAWRISDESFMDRFDYVDDLKFRVSWGFLGNESIGDFQFLGTWSAATYNGVSGIGPASVDNPNLQWEKTREINAGFDLSLNSGQIQAYLDVYNNLTTELLFSRQLPATTGFGAVLGNVGSISNKGVELSVSTVNMDRERFSWRTSLNLSRNINKVVFLEDSLPIFRGYTGSGVAATSVIKEGEPLGSFWGLEFMGVDPATGDAIYWDTNGDGVITDADAKIIGDAQPDLIGGITNTVNWRNFEASLFIQFSYGNKILNFANATLLNTGENIQNNQAKAALDRWQEPGDITDIPRYEYGNTFNNLHSSRFLEDGSYLRIKSLSLGYNVPPEFTSRYGISRMKVYMSAMNLLTLTPYTGADPEVSTLDGSVTAQGIDFFTLPQVRTLMMGLKIML